MAKQERKANTSEVKAPVVTVPKIDKRARTAARKAANIAKAAQAVKHVPHGQTRAQHRAAEREAQEKQARIFTIKMQQAKEAKVAQKLFLERGVKLAALPTEESKRIAQEWQAKAAARREKEQRA